MPGTRHQGGAKQAGPERHAELVLADSLVDQA